MSTLSGTKIKDTYSGLLKTTDNAALNGTFKAITDGAGNASGLELNNTYARATSGMLFGADTAAANALDDYEEGTSTLTLTGGTTAPTVAPTTTAYYTKIGNLVTISFKFGNVDVTGVVGVIVITGLPFTSRLTTAQGSLWCGRASDSSLVLFMDANSTQMSVVNGGGSNVTWASDGTGTYCGGSITYSA